MRNKHSTDIIANNRMAHKLWPDVSACAISILGELTTSHKFSIAMGDLIFLDGRWYVTAPGLLGVARRKRCTAMLVEPVVEYCNPSARRWVFRATVFKAGSKGTFVGYGDADPSNIAAVVRGAEMRVAETRAVNRALRKAYGIGICSVEELGSPAESRHPRKIPPQSANVNGNYGGPKVRDRLCQLIRQHGLDAGLVKSYAVDFCGTKALRDATREQVEAFVAHLSDWAEKDRNALVCQLNSYLPQQSKKEEGAA